MVFAKHQLDELARESFPAPGEQPAWDPAAGPLWWDWSLSLAFFWR